MAAKNKSVVFTALFHHMDEAMLHAAYTLVRKDGATGVDGVSGAQYAANLEENLKGLYQRLKEKRYRAPLVRRVRIEKADGGERVLGITTFEDKIVQKAVAMLLGTVYEQDFLECSYGFRPRRSQHQAISAIREQCKATRVQWILDADIKAYFDTIPHALLQEIVRKRVNDGNVMRLIGKWLHTGAVDLGDIIYPEEGTPQGGVVSPLLANIYLHEVLDTWFAQEVLPRLKGKAFLVRYADDFVIGFETEEDARKVYEVLPKRFAKYGLTIHPEKTKLRRFGKPRSDDHDSSTFDFLGFTHYWGKTQEGYWCIKRKTARKRLRRTLKAMWSWCKANRHKNVKWQHLKLCVKLRGHYQYFGVRCNSDALGQVAHYAKRIWKYWLGHRSNESGMTWKMFARLLERFPLPKPRIVQTC